MNTQLEYFEENLDRVNRMLNYLTQLYLGKRGLNMSRFRVLQFLHIKKCVNMSALQDYLLISAGALTELVDSLEKEKLVTRAREQFDRRMVYLSLTEAGREVYREVLDFRCGCLRKALSLNGAGPPQAEDEIGRTAALEGMQPDLKDTNNILQLFAGGLKMQIKPGEADNNRYSQERCGKNES